MTASESPARLYRLSPPDRTGWLWGLSLGQLAVVGGTVVAATLTMFFVWIPAGFGVLAVGCGVGLIRVKGTSLVDLAPRAVRHASHSVLKRGDVWLAPVPALPTVTGSKEPMPTVLAGQDVLVVDSPARNDARGSAAVVRDPKTGMCAATLRVAGRPFGLMDGAEQDWLVGQWGNSLQGFVSERPAVRQVRWSEWAAPAGLNDHLAWCADQFADDPVPEAKASYDWLLAHKAADAVRHEVLVTLIVQPERNGGSRTKRRDWAAVGVELALSEARLFAERLAAAGLVVSGPLSSAEVARAVRVRLDPTCRAALDGRQRSLGDDAGGVSVANAGPTAARSQWNAWQVDGSWHRGFHIAEWPRLDVPAGWLGQLIGWADTVRSITVSFEPIPRSRSQRSITRDAAKISSDVEHRTGKGFRVGAHHRRAAQAVEEREEELVAGYGEFSYAGVVTITTPTIEQLDWATERIISAAAAVGIELRQLHGRHDQAVAATLPLARGVAPRWTP